MTNQTAPLPRSWLQAGQTRFFELVAFFPADFGGLIGGLPTQGESEAGDGGVGGPVEAGTIFVVGLVIAFGDVLVPLRQAPGGVVALEFHALVNAETGDANAREAEVVGAI